MNIEKILTFIDENLIITLTKKMIEMGSQNPPGKTNHIVEYLQKECLLLGFQVQIEPLDNQRQNIVISLGSEKRDIILSGHLDTVPIGEESNWDYPPLKATIVDGKIFGRGSADMLGGVATLIAVMDAIKKSGVKLTHRIVFLGTADEEVGMNGASHLKKLGYMEKADCLIITEATDMRVGIAEKGPLWVRVKVIGKAAHGSIPEAGINAIEGATEVIQNIKSIIPKFSHDLLGKSTLNIGLISGGTKINIVPEQCHIELDFRLVPGVNVDDFNNKLTRYFNELSAKYPHKFSHEIVHFIPALSTNQNELIIQNLLHWSAKITGNPPNPIGLTYATDAAVLLPHENIPFAIIGGGSSTIIHKANEFVPIEELVNTAKIITSAIVSTFKE